MQVVVEATRVAVPALLDGRIDVGIVSDPIKNSRLAIEALFEDELVAVLPVNHPLRRAPFLDAADLARAASPALSNLRRSGTHG